MDDINYYINLMSLLTEVRLAYTFALETMEENFQIYDLEYTDWRNVDNDYSLT